MNDTQQSYQYTPITDPKVGDWVICRYPDVFNEKTHTNAQFGKYYQIERVIPAEELLDCENEVHLVGIVHLEAYSNEDYGTVEAGEVVRWGYDWFEAVPELVQYMLTMEEDGESTTGGLD